MATFYDLPHCFVARDIISGYIPGPYNDHGTLTMVVI